MTLEWLMLGAGFTGALTIVFFVRGLGHRLGIIPSLTPHFSPKGGCTDAIIKELRLARREILVQAYSFSCPVIATGIPKRRREELPFSFFSTRPMKKRPIRNSAHWKKRGWK